MPDANNPTQADRLTIAVVGNPNTGKSTLFNNLTGLRQKTANYPGVTVERHSGKLRLDAGDVELIDVPGAYSLAAYSPDEMVSADVLQGRFENTPRPSAILIVIDATNLRRNLFMTTQILELGIPVVVALNMMDIAAKRDIAIDTAKLAKHLDVQVVPIVAGYDQGTSRYTARTRCSTGAARCKPCPHCSRVAEPLRKNSATGFRNTTWH